MNAFEQKRRRSFLWSVGALGISQILPQGIIEGQAVARQGSLPGATEGKPSASFRDNGNIFIKLASATGSDNLALGPQQVMVGPGIPVHRHFKMDETFYVLEGSGIFALNDVRHSFE